MAEEKKPEAKPAPAPEKDAFVDLVSIVVVLFLLASLLGALAGIFGNIGGEGGSADAWYKRFTPTGIWKAHTVPVSSLMNPIGARVVSLNKTDVYDSPGGKKIGEQKIGSRGKVLEGPVEIDGIKYYYVDYDDGQDGWVKESDIGAIQSEPNVVERFILWLFSVFGLIKIIFYLLTVVIVLFIVYLFVRINSIAESQRALIYPEIKIEQNKGNPKWERILKYSDSLNENDWRLAIIESDIMLSELLEALSLPGETIGDKLKLIERSDFLTLDNAWEAHKFRNSIAHEGVSFLINQKEAKRIISLYQSVFEEFEVI